MKRILIVDDAIELGRVLQDTLKTVHPELPVSIVPSAEEALLETGRFTIDLLVTDLRLPGMTGVELIRKMRKRQPGIKIILITGLARDSYVEGQIEEGRPDRFLHKPIAPGDFLDAVQEVLELAAPGSPASSAVPAEEAGGAAPVSQRTPSAASPLVFTPHAPVSPVSGPFAPAEEGPGLSALLRDLRGSLGARSAVLLDERGRPVAQAGGDVTELSGESAVLAPLMAAVSAAEKVSSTLGLTMPRAVQAFRGAAIDLVAVPVGPYTLVVALEPERSVLRLALTFEAALQAQSDLAAALAAMGLRLDPAGAAPPLAGGPDAATPGGAGMEDAPGTGFVAGPEALDPGAESGASAAGLGAGLLEEMLARQQSGELSLPDADDFWSAAGEESRGPEQSGVLSLEQARKLGLFPDPTGEP